MRTVLALVALWLMVGSFVAGTRDATSDRDACSRGATIAATALLGPVNYLGAEPAIVCPESMVERQKD